MREAHITVFLADDDEDDREFFSEAMLLINKNAHLIIVKNGIDAVNYFNNMDSMPDFVFLDINMPGQNGLECLKHLKSNYPNDLFHIIILSTSTSENDINFSYTHGASAYIQKPGSFSELKRYLAHCIQNLTFSPKREDFILNDKLKGTVV